MVSANWNAKKVSLLIMDNAQNAHQSVLNVILKICVQFVQKELLVI